MIYVAIRKVICSLDLADWRQSKIIPKQDIQPKNNPEMQIVFLLTKKEIVECHCQRCQLLLQRFSVLSWRKCFDGWHKQYCCLRALISSRRIGQHGFLGENKNSGTRMIFSGMKMDILRRKVIY